MSIFKRANAHTMRRSAQNRFHPSVDALDDRVLPSAGLSSVAGAATVHHLKALAVAKIHVPVNVHKPSHPIVAQKKQVVAKRTVSRPLPPRAPVPKIKIVSRPLPRLAPAPPIRIVPRPVVPSPVTPPPAVNSVSGTESALEMQIVSLMNQQRQQNGLPALQVSSQLVMAAQIHSRDMAQLNDMDHTLPGAAQPALQDRLSFVGYNWQCAGENIAEGYPDATTVIQGWMNSPEHRANILNTSFTQIGIGVAYSSSGMPYYTQEFGELM
jgi:uncharacterized protein YkwD